MYAGHLCCFAPNSDGLQGLINVCSKHAESHCTGIVFNASKSTGMIFHVPFSKYFLHKLYIAGNPINFSNSVKYLDGHLNQLVTDNNDIMGRVKFLFTRGNNLQSYFSKCSVSVKDILFCTHCSCFYASHLWGNFKSESFRRSWVSFNDSYCMLHKIPCIFSARFLQIQVYIEIFNALIRKMMRRFVGRCHQSENSQVMR